MKCPHNSASDNTCDLMHGFPFNGRCTGEEFCPFLPKKEREHQEELINKVHATMTPRDFADSLAALAQGLSHINSCLDYSRAVTKMMGNPILKLFPQLRHDMVMKLFHSMEAAYSMAIHFLIVSGRYTRTDIPTLDELIK